MRNKKKIVLSGANITSGGPLTIFNEALDELSQCNNSEIIAIVNSKELFFKSDNISFIEIPNYKKFVFLKFYYEYVYFKDISKRVEPDIWISLNDFTPNVSARSVFTYFHNAAIFFKIEWRDILFSNRVIFQKFYYRLFLQFNIRKNKKFIVQQNWIAESIHDLYNLPIKQLLIFKPNFTLSNYFPVEQNENNNFEKKLVLFYPTKAAGYKNIEFICEALNVLSKRSSVKNIELRLTIDKDENLYSKYLNWKYKNLTIIWLGSISKDKVEENYKEASVLIFPSRLETWGLPLTEFAKYNKPIFAIDLGYVYETLQDYPYLAFFKPNNVNQLVELLSNKLNGIGIDYYIFNKRLSKNYNIDNVNVWNELLNY